MSLEADLYTESAPISDYDHDMLVYGSAQDFNIFADR